MTNNLNMSFSLYRPERKIRQREDFSKQILEYGLYNNYPQLILALYQRSGVTSVCVEHLSNFLYGEGFANTKLAETVVNEKGETFDDLLRSVCKSVAIFRGASLHFNFNMLNEWTSAHCLNFEWTRLGLPDNNLYSDKIAYWDDWDGQSSRHNRSQADIVYFDRWNPNLVGAQSEEAGGFGHYKGQVNYFSLEGTQYPRCTFDSVLEDVETNSRIKNFKRNAVKNGFSASKLIEYPGTFESFEEKMAFLQMANGMTGDENAGEVKVAQNPNGAEVPLKIHDLQPQNVDKLHEITERTVKENIIETFGIPKPLITGGQQVFSQDQLVDSYLIFNELTRPLRDDISRFFCKIIPHFREEIDISDRCEIISKSIKV